MSIASAPAADAGAEGEDTERLLSQSPRGVSTSRRYRTAVCRRVLTCALPHRLTAHVEELTPLTEDSLLFDGPRTDVRACPRPAPDRCRQRGPGVPWGRPGDAAPGRDQGAPGRPPARTGRDRRHRPGGRARAIGVAPGTLSDARQRRARGRALRRLGVRRRRFARRRAARVRTGEHRRCLAPAARARRRPRQRGGRRCGARQPAPARHHRRAGAHRADRHRRGVGARASRRPAARTAALLCPGNRPRPRRESRLATSSRSPRSPTSG